MAFRGRGRGGGGFGGGFGGRRVEPQKFDLYPKLYDEENFPKGGSVKEQTALMVWSWRLQNFWNSSPYYLENKGRKKEESTDVERFSDRGKKRKLQKDNLSDFIKCTVEYVPGELARDSKSQRYSRKKVRWNQDSGLKKLDLFEKLEQGQEKSEKGKEDGENEEEDDEQVDEGDEEFSDDGDYNQNVDFDDDEDDFNMADDDDEGFF